MHPQLYRRKPGGPISARYTDANGVRQRESTKCTDEKAALAWLRNKEREVHNSPYATRHASKVTVSDAIDYFLINGIKDVSPETVGIYKTKTGHLNRLLRDKEESPSWELSTVDMKKMNAYTTQRTKEGAHPHTVKKELNVFKKLLDTCTAGGYFVCQPKEIIPKWDPQYSPLTRWVTLDQFKAILDEIDSEELTIPGLNRRAWILTCLYTGMRRKEVNNLKWKDVDFNLNSVSYLHATKTRKARVMQLPLARPLRDFLLPLRGRSEDLVTGAQWWDFYAAMKRACKRADVHYVTSNDFRRSYASWLLQAGVSNFVVSKLMRHATTHMVDLVYGQLDLKTMAKAQDLINVEPKLD